MTFYWPISAPGRYSFGPEVAPIPGRSGYTGVGCSSDKHLGSFW